MAVGVDIFQVVVILCLCQCEWNHEDEHVTWPSSPADSATSVQAANRRI